MVLSRLKTSRFMNIREFNNLQLQSVFESGDTSDPLDEIILLVSQVCPEVDLALVRKVHTDVSAIFSGRYPGFRVNTARYHNLRHTFSVVLASIRLFHSLFHEKVIKIRLKKNTWQYRTIHENPFPYSMEYQQKSLS